MLESIIQRTTLGRLLVKGVTLLSLWGCSNGDEPSPILIQASHSSSDAGGSLEDSSTKKGDSEQKYSDQSPENVCPNFIAEIANETIKEGETFTLKNEVYNPSGKSLSFSMNPFPMDSTLDISTGEFTFSPDYSFVIHPETKKSLAITFTVSDGYCSNSVKGHFTVLDKNRCPTIDQNLTYILDSETKKGKIKAVVKSNDPDKEDKLQVSMKSKDKGVVLHPNGLIEITASPCDKAIYSVDVEVSDGFCTVKQSFDIDVPGSKGCISQKYVRINNELNILNQIENTNDGLILGGNINPNIGSSKETSGWVVKTDQKGVMQWDTYFGKDTWINSVHQLPTLEYLVGGQNLDKKGATVVRLDSKGKLVWANNDQKQHAAVEARPLGKASIVIAKGHELSRMLTNVVNVPLWTSKTNKGEYIASMDVTKDEDIIIAGATYNTSNGNKLGPVWVAKRDSSGKEEWYKKLGGIWFPDGRNFQETPDGDYIIAIVKGDEHVSLTRLSKMGNNIQWTKHFYNLGSKVNDLYINSGGGYALVTEDAIVNLNSKGSLQWKLKKQNGSEVAYEAVSQDSNGNYLLVSILNDKGVVKSSLRSINSCGQFCK